MPERSTTIYKFSSPPEAPKPRIEKGEVKSPTAIYGCSIGYVKRALEQNALLPDEIKLPYQEKLVAGGKYLYYALPLVDTWEPQHDELVARMYQSYREQELPEEQVRWELSLENQHRHASGYAQRQALKHYFFDQTGRIVDDQHLLTIADILIPQNLDSFFKRNPQAHVDSSAGDDPQVDQLMKAVKRRNLKKLLPEALKRHGVILHLGNEIYNHEIHPGEEDDHEIMIVSKKPLPLGTIIGIEPRGEEDEKLLVKLIP